MSATGGVEAGAGIRASGVRGQKYVVRGLKSDAAGGQIA